MDDRLLLLPPTLSSKRDRDDDALDVDSSPEIKRIRTDLDDVLDLLDGSDDRNPDAAADLASVMRSLEEEIAFSSPAPAISEVPPEDLGQPELGFLLEASDDELGLPPTSEGVAGAPEIDGFGQIWGFEDEIPRCYGGTEFSFAPEEEEVVVFDGGLFDDFGDDEYTWRYETLPAV